MVTEFPNALSVLALLQVLQAWFLCIIFNYIKYRIQLILLKAMSCSPINKASSIVAFHSKLMQSKFFSNELLEARVSCLNWLGEEDWVVVFVMVWN